MYKATLKTSGRYSEMADVFAGTSGKHYPTEKKQLYDRFFDLSPDLLCTVGFDGYIRTTSPSFEQVFGYSKEELLSKPLFDFVLPEDLTATYAELSMITNGGVPSHFENRCIAKDGTIKWMAWRSVSVPEEQIMYAVGRDITVQKQAELLLKRQSGKLEELINQKNGSLRYARLLQDALFHDPETFRDIFPRSFIYYSPQDILGGDLYWFEKRGNKAYVACADCTGHSIPGAMLSVLAVNKLHETISLLGSTSPSKILEHLNRVISYALGRKDGTKKMDDGMDIALYSVDLDTLTLEYAGANLPLYVVRDGYLIEIKPDKQGIGDSTEPFTNHTLQLHSDDLLYTFSDGYADQFGGTDGKKFMRRQFKKLLSSNAGKSMSEQKEALDLNIKNWMGEYEQIDDMCVIGIRID